MYIQIFGKQKKVTVPSPISSMSTSSYFDKKIKEATNTVYGQLPSKKINTELLKLNNELGLIKLKAAHELKLADENPVYHAHKNNSSTACILQ